MALTYIRHTIRKIQNRTPPPKNEKGTDLFDRKVLINLSPFRRLSVMCEMLFSAVTYDTFII